MKAPVFLLFLFFACPAVASFENADSVKKLPAANPPRSRASDIRHIALDLRFDISARRTSGTAAITLSLFNSDDRFRLDAAMLTIRSIRLPNGTPLQFNYAGDDKDDNLEVILDKVRPANEEFTVVIDYHTNWVNMADPNNIWGSFGKGVRYFEPTSTTPIKRQQIWSMGEAQSNRYWFPGFDGPNDLRTTELKATVKNNLTVVSNGTLINTKDNGDGTHTFHWKADKPYPNYLTSFVVGEYIDVKQQYQNIPLHTFGYPDERAAIEATVVRLPDMVKFFSEKTGVTYPFAEYSQVVVQDFPFPGLIGQHGTTTISDNMIDDFRTHADFFYLWDGVEAQSLAAQWFGNLLTPRDWRDIWLSGSFSHYLDALYNEYKNGKEEVLCNYIPFDQSVVMSDWTNGYRHPIVTGNFENADAFTSDNHARIRGALVLRMLHQHLGDERWWKAVRHYLTTNAGRQVSTENLVAAIEESTGESMGWFFDQWVYTMGHPIFEVMKKYEAGRLTLTLKQNQTVDPTDRYPQTEFFQGKMVIEIDGMLKEVWLEPRRENTFSFTSPQPPKFVNVDREGMWIKEIVFSKTTDELIRQLQYSGDIVARNAAINELSMLATKEQTSNEEKARIVAVMREIITGTSYWRLRLNALTQLRKIQAGKPDKATIVMLLNVIKKDKSWVRVSAITSLGMTRDPKYADTYIHYLEDESDRVINAAAIALGKTKSSKAYDALMKLSVKPSWKSQSMISALNGLKELGDPRGFDLAFKALSDVHSPRWWLNTSVWDYPIAAAETLVALKKSDAAYPLILERFKKSLADNDYNDIFANVSLITTLADPRGHEVFEILKEKFKNDENAMVAVRQYEAQFSEALGVGH